MAIKEEKYEKTEPPKDFEVIGLDRKPMRYWIEESNGKYVLYRSKKGVKWELRYKVLESTEPLEIAVEDNRLVMKKNSTTA